MTATYQHNGKQIQHGGYTLSGAYRATRVDSRWHFHPADSDWLAFNANDEFSPGFDTETEALEAAVQWEACYNA